MQGSPHNKNDSGSAQFNFTLSRPENDQAALLAAVEQFGVKNALPDALRYRIGLIVDELVTNCIAHGACTGKNQTVQVSISNKKDELVIEITDSGLPFDPTTHPLPLDPESEPMRVGGVGLCLVRRLTDKMQYTRNDNRNHVVISLDKTKRENACSLKR
jgi:anti-sigma regulatory factor (Ser/Thr protein kinase)